MRIPDEFFIRKFYVIIYASTPVADVCPVPCEFNFHFFQKTFQNIMSHRSCRALGVIVFFHISLRFFMVKPVLRHFHFKENLNIRIWAALILSSMKGFCDPLLINKRFLWATLNSTWKSSIRRCESFLPAWIAKITLFRLKSVSVAAEFSLRSVSWEMIPDFFLLPFYISICKCKCEMWNVKCKMWNVSLKAL